MGIPVEVEGLQLLDITRLDAVDRQEGVARGGRHLVQRAHVHKLLQAKRNESTTNKIDCTTQQQGHRRWSKPSA